MKLLSSLTLTLILAVSAYGGNMQNPAPDPPPTTQVTEPTEPTNIVEPTETTDTTDTAEIQTPTVILLTVMSVLGLI